MIWKSILIIKKGILLMVKLSKRAVLLYYLKLLLMKLHYRNLHFLNSSDVEDFYQRLIRISSELGNEYDGENLLSIACLLCIVRFTNERFEFSLLELRDLGETEELQLIDNYFQDFNVHERLYLAVHLLGSKAGNALKVKDNEDDISLFELAQRMCDTFERLACVKLADKNDLVNSLYIHFKLSMYYYKLSIQVVNPLMKEVKENYYDLYQMVKHMCNELSDELPFPVLDSEIVYITMHFGGHLHNGAGNFYRKVRVLVVCPSGISTSTLLRREIEQLYSNVTVVASATANNIWEYEDDIDFIVSTINLKTEVPWIKVNAILSNEDKSRIASMMMLSFNTYTMDDKQMNGLVHLIEKYVPEDKIDALKNDLVKYLQKGNVLVKVEEQDKTRILDALSVENIQICDEEFYWKDAVVKASQTLLAQNVIKEKYIQAMIELLEDYGPYIVLQNKVAIAHASPSQGANTFGLALLVNRKDILFEDSKVKYLFVLSNPDQEKHLHLMRDIMYLSSQKEMLDEIDDMKDAESILRKLTEVTRNMQNEF